MIKSVQVKSGFMLQSSHILNRKFEFTDGLNVLFGENGVYKSSLLKTMAAYCGIEKAAWSQISNPANLAASVIEHFPTVYRKYAPGQTDAIVEWDGTPTFYNDSDSISKTDTTWFFSSNSQSSDGLTSESEQMDILASKPSSGQFRIHKINKIMQVIQQPPNLGIVPPNINDKKMAMLEVDYIKSLPRTGKMTLLLDEPEKALFLPRQDDLFNVLVQLSKHFQVIIVTHSPFILPFKEANIIDMIPGASKTCKDLIRKRFKIK
jgi:energy-coupling factor transporter ATP-binding protein EcfA2